MHKFLKISKTIFILSQVDAKWLWPSGCCESVRKSVVKQPIPNSRQIEDNKIQYLVLPHLLIRRANPKVRQEYKEHLKLCRQTAAATAKAKLQKTAKEKMHGKYDLFRQIGLRVKSSDKTAALNNKEQLRKSIQN